MNAAMMSEADDAPWQIVMAQLPLAFGLAGHNFLVLLDGNVHVASEINGLAIGQNGSVRAVGWRPGDRLHAVVNSGSCYYRADLGQAVLYAGPRQAAMRLWLQAEEKACAINALALKYPFLGCGRNSNSVASTLIHAMGLAECRPSRSAVIDFGCGKILVLSLFSLFWFAWQATYAFQCKCSCTASYLEQACQQTLVLVVISKTYSVQLGLYCCTSSLFHWMKQAWMPFFHDSPSPLIRLEACLNWFDHY